MIDPLGCLISFILALCLSLIIYKFGLLTKSGCVSAFAIGFLIGALGSVWWLALLIVFALLGFAATVMGLSKKREKGLQEGTHGERSYKNILGVATPPLIVAILNQVYPGHEWAFSVAYIATIAVAAADTAASEIGVKEQLGKVTESNLHPGIYWTLPWPFGRVRTFGCNEIKQLVIGEVAVSVDRRDAAAADDDGHGHAPAPAPDKDKVKQVVLWTEAHGEENSNFLVAVPRENGAANDESASVSLLRLSIPIQYRIRPDGVMLYGYKNANPVKTLMKIGEQAATEYQASSSLMDVMSSHRLQAQQAMLQKIQKLADDHQLGIEVVAVAILDAHPPTETVAPAYQNVVGALEKKETAIYQAKAYAALTRPEASAAANEIVANAEAYRYQVKTVAAAESGRFKAQLTAYQVMPRMFKLKTFLEFMEQDCTNMRKFVVSSDLNDEIYQLNFEQKERLDLVDTDITAFDK